jgi:GTPase
MTTLNPHGHTMLPDAARLSSLAQGVVGRDARAIARAITLVENRAPGYQELLREIFPKTGRAPLVGITGAPGSGKSTLADALAAALRQRGHSVGILAIDPTSPFSGGAILGDRIRMAAHSTDPDIFIRSMATRGALGGLAAAAVDAAMVLDAAAKDLILIETVGVGQDEVDIARVADVTLLLLDPSMGDDVQAMKAGVMEIANIFVLNKSDLPGADRLEADIRSLVILSPSSAATRVPVVRTVATACQGIDKLIGQMFCYLEEARMSGAFEERRRRYWRQRIVELVREQLMERLLSDRMAHLALDKQAEAVAARCIDPYSAAETLLLRRARRGLSTNRARSKEGENQKP